MTAPARPTAPVLLAAQGLSHTYPDSSTPALRGVDLRIGVGESVAIMGASGSGKSTLLHALAGIIAPTAGSIVLNTPAGPIRMEELSENQRASVRRRDLGFVFQQGLLLHELSALENVAVALMLGGTPRPEAELAAAQWLARLGLAGLEHRRLGELSGGQAQRVAIARAQVTGARLIFADEPTGALDSATSAEVLDLLLDAVEPAETRSGGRSLVVVTHDRAVAERCARLITLSDGRIVADESHRGTAGPAGETSATAGERA